MQRFGGFALVLALAGGWTAPPLVTAQGTETGVATPDSTIEAKAADSLAAEQTDTTAKPAAAAAPVPDEPKKSLAISGYVTASYTYSTSNAGSTIVGRFYDRFHDQFVFNAAKVVFDLAPATDKLDAGFRADFLFGQNAAVTKSAGLNLGDNGDVTQAFAVVNIPAGEGKYVQFKAGKMATLMGVEVIEDVVNPNLSVANQFVFLENFTNTGLRVDVKPGPKVDFQLALFNGWDVVEDNNSRKSFMGRLGLTPTDQTTIGLLGYFGPEQANATNNRYGGEIVITQKVGSRGTVFFQGDYGAEEDLVAPGDNATWWGVGLWGVYDLSSNVALALRGDYVDDNNGPRTSAVFGFPAHAGHKFGSGTVTLNIKAFPAALIRPEIRYDRSNQAFFGDPADPSKDQVSFALGASYIF